MRRSITHDQYGEPAKVLRLEHVTDPRPPEGEEVLIRVVEPIQADEPERKPRKDADAEAAQERLTYEWLKRKYEAR